MYSVIIPSLGRKEYLIPLLESILIQTLEPAEILLLLDNNLQCELISLMVADYELVSAHLLTDCNLADKRNLGARMARSELILYSDDDDLWHPTKAERVVASLEQCDAVCHGFSRFGEREDDSVLLARQESGFISPLKLLSGSNVFGGGSSIAARKSLLLTLQFCASYRYCEDLEWWSRVILAGCKVYYIAQPLVSYRVHTKNMTNSLLKIEEYRLKLARKYFIFAGLSLGISFMYGIKAFAALGLRSICIFSAFKRKRDFPKR